MKNREWKDIIAFAVFLVTFAGLLFGFYNGIRADMRDMRAEMREMRTEMRVEFQVIHGTLADVRERLAVIETEIGISPHSVQTGVAEQRSTREDAIEQGPATQGAMARVVRAVIPAPLAWWVDVYAMRPARNACARLVFT